MHPVFALHGESPVVSAVFFRLTLPGCRVGRSSTCELVIRDGTVSRRHAELFVADGSATILDLDSFNGTFVNEARVHSAELQSGDKVQFGSVAFRFTAARTEKCDDDSESATDRPTNSVRVAENNLRKLSPAQRRVVKLLLKGHPEKHVASLLHLSITTVHNHIQAAYRILDVHSRSELLILLLEK